MTIDIKEKLAGFLSDKTQKGLYIFLPDDSEISITREFIEEFAQNFLNNPSFVQAELKQMADYQNCHICPLQSVEGSFCRALQPVLPLIERLDQFQSFDPVMIVHKGHRPDMLLVAHTSLQRALSHITTLSLMYYCETGRKHWKYFFGASPMMPLARLASRIYLNIYFDCKGKEEDIDKKLDKFIDEIKCIGDCIIKRLRLFCQSDPLLNAFASVRNLAEYLNVCRNEVLLEELEEFESENSML